MNYCPQIDLRQNICADVNSFGAGAVRQLADVHQLPGVAAEEELAERQVPVHQELHGQASAALLGARDLLGSSSGVWWDAPVSAPLSNSGLSPAPWQRLGTHLAALLCFDSRRWAEQCEW